MAGRYDWQDIFRELGKLVKAANIVKSVTKALLEHEVEILAEFDDDAGDRAFLQGALRQMNSAEAACSSAESGFGLLAQNYLTSRMLEKTECTWTALTDVLEDMISKMRFESQTVKGNQVAIVPWHEKTGDNNEQLAGFGDVLGLTSANCHQDGNDYRWYVNIVNDGGGYYHVDIYKSASKTGDNLIAHTESYNTTGAKPLLADNNSGVTGYIFVAAVVEADSDIVVTWRFGDHSFRKGTGYLTDWAATQMAIKDDLRIVCTSVAAGAGFETWEVVSRVRGRAPTMATTGVAWPTKEADDKLGVRFTISRRTTYVEWNDENNQLSGYANLTGVNASNTDGEGKLYVNIVSVGGGFYHVELFKDSGRTALVGHTGNYNTVGPKVVYEDNGSGLGGTITVDAVVGADADIQVLCPREFAVGDAFLLSTNVSEIGVFQTFFRRHVGRTLPYDVPGAETIGDVLAE